MRTRLEGGEVPGRESDEGLGGFPRFDLVARGVRRLRNEARIAACHRRRSNRPRPGVAEVTNAPGPPRVRDQSPAAVTDGNLRSLTVGVVTLLELSAPWCPTCLNLGPLCDVLARQHAGLVRITRCDIDANPGVAAALGVRSVPLVVVFAADGSEVGRVGGAFARRSLQRVVTEALERPRPDVGTGLSG